MNNLTCWQRLEYEGRAVYINPEKPDWFVPNSKADILIQGLLKEGQTDENILDQILLGSQISTEPAQPYHGRADLLSWALSGRIQTGQRDSATGGNSPANGEKR